ncbi:hypothetical protein NMY22_g3869 [Coprinellus aureogranulatus]|nr:hypothetical protein NMY22_g3869 [Coprinellus aureogranulatus]
MALIVPDSLLDLVALSWIVYPEEEPDQGSTESLTSKEAVRQTAEQHNDTSPINSIPAELLCRIFLHLRPNLMPSNKLGSGRFHGLGRHRRPNVTWLFAMTHVCRYWRQAACGEPTLWNHLALPESEKIKTQMGSTFIKRAGPTLPLHIQEPITSSKLFISSLTAGQWKRLKTLCLASCIAQEGQALAALTTLQQASAPNLATLLLDARVPSLPRVFQGRPQSLRSLTLIQTPQWDNMCDFSHLTHLKFASQPVAPRLPFPSFLHLLRRVPRLQYLSLDNAGPSMTQPHGLLERVALNYLRVIDLCDALHEPRNLLIHLSLPVDCIIHCARHWARISDISLFGSRNPTYDESGIPCQPAIAIFELNSPKSADYDRLVFQNDRIYFITRQWSDRHATGMEDVLRTVTEIYIGGYCSYAALCGTVLWKWILRKTPNVRSITFTTDVDMGSIIEYARRLEGGTAERLERLRFRTSARSSLSRCIRKVSALGRLEDGNAVLWRTNRQSGGLTPCSIVLEDVVPPAHPIFARDQD